MQSDRVRFLSPSAIACYQKSPDEYYLRYLATNRPPKEDQTQPMAAGGAFDAHCKAWLKSKLKGEDTYENLLEDFLTKQVEAHNLDWARRHGAFLFQQYKDSGALADLLIELEQSLEEPRFEFEVTGLIERDLQKVILLGKPDVYYISRGGVHVIHDWKVNGYCGSSNTSPKKGYVMSRDGWIGTQSKSHRRPHKDYMPVILGDVTINCMFCLEDVDKEWAQQLSIYAWLLGERVGAQFVARVDQLTGTGTKRADEHWIRVSTHKLRVSEEFQEQLFNTACYLWYNIKNDTLYKQEDIDRLELIANGMQGSDPESRMFRGFSR